MMQFKNVPLMVGWQPHRQPAKKAGMKTKKHKKKKIIDQRREVRFNVRRGPHLGMAATSSSLLWSSASPTSCAISCDLTTSADSVSCAAGKARSATK
jgi:hypothetical protein